MSAHATGVATDMAIMALLALSAYLLLLVGRVSFGQQAFFGIGAYAAGIASAVAGLPMPVALAVGVAVGAVLGAALARLMRGLSGLQFAIGTLAFAEMVRIAFQAWHWQVERDGVPVGPAGTEGFRDIRWLLENDVSTGGFLLGAVAVLLTVLVGLSLVERIRLGQAIRMTGHDDVLATSQGVPVEAMRTSAATLAGALAALGGGLYAHRTTYIEPAIFDPMLGVHAVGYALIGGLGTAIGPLLGVALDIGLLEATRVFAGWRMVVFGGLIALFLRFRPRGLLDENLLNALSQRLRRARRPAGARLGVTT
jgi:branched-chain amino acid transport system permease protein